MLIWQKSFSNASLGFCQAVLTIPFLSSYDDKKGIVNNAYIVLVAGSNKDVMCFILYKSHKIGLSQLLFFLPTMFCAILHQLFYSSFQLMSADFNLKINWKSTQKVLKQKFCKALKHCFINEQTLHAIYAIFQ